MDIIEKAIKTKEKILLRKAEGFVGSAYVELELFYDESWKPKPYILRASSSSGIVVAERYEKEKQAEADYMLLKDKYNLKIATPQK